MTDLLFGPNVTLALIGAAGALAMFFSLYAATPHVDAGTLERLSRGRAGPTGWRASLQSKLDQADFDISVDEFVRIVAVLAIVGVVIGYAITRTITGTLMLGALGPLGYWTHLETRREKQRQLYQESLARATAIIRDSVSTGKVLIHALEDVARRGPRIVQADFREIVDQERLGQPIRETLNRIRQRRRDPIFDMLAENLLVHSGHGGSIAQVLERLADATRRRTEVRRRVQAEQARVMWEARGVSISPFIILLLTRLTLPDLVRPFYGSPWGELAILLIGVISAGSYFLVVRLGAAPLKVLDTVFVPAEDTVVDVPVSSGASDPAQVAGEPSRQEPDREH